MAAVSERHPKIVLHITENHGGVLSEAIRNRALDMALIYEPGAIRGVQFTTLLNEDLFVIGRADDLAGRREFTFTELLGTDLLLPGRNHTIRQALEDEARRREEPLRVAAEIESVSSLVRLISAGIGATVMPESAVRTHLADARFGAARLVDPVLKVSFSLCSADREPLSEPAAAVLVILRELFQRRARRAATERAAAERALSEGVEEVSPPPAVPSP